MDEDLANDQSIDRTSFYQELTAMAAERQHNQQTARAEFSQQSASQSQDFSTSELYRKIGASSSTASEEAKTVGDQDLSQLDMCKKIIQAQLQINTNEDVDREVFYEKIKEALSSKQSHNTFLLTREKYESLIQQMKRAEVCRKTPADFRRVKRLTVVNTPEGERLYLKTKPGQPQLMFVTIDEMYDIIKDYHVRMNHAGRSKLMTCLKKRYKNITAQSVLIYLGLCRTCKNGHFKRGRIIKKPDNDESLNEEVEQDQEFDDNADENDPLTNDSQDDYMEMEDMVERKMHPELYSRGQVDILEVSDNTKDTYRYLLVYRNLVTRFIHLTAMRATNVEETVEALLDIFLVFGAPNVLQCKNGMAVTKPICRRISTVCPDIKVAASEAVCSEKEFKGKTNADILRKLNEWLEWHKSRKWQNGVKFVQHALNTTFNEVLCRTPSEVVFGTNPKRGILSFLNADVCADVTTEDELNNALDEKEDDPDTSKGLKLQESLISPCKFIKSEPMQSGDDL